jgi:hypothetical protein
MKCKMRIHPSAVAEHYLSLILSIKIFWLHVIQGIAWHTTFAAAGRAEPPFAA